MHIKRLLRGNDVYGQRAASLEMWPGLDPRGTS